MIIVRAPLRVSFFGGGTDHPDWFTRHGPGAVLSTSVNKYCYIQLRPLPHIFPFNYRVVWRKVEQVVSIGEIEHPVVRAVLQHYAPPDLGGIEVVYNADLPARSGLASSSAFTVTMLQALLAHLGIYKSQRELAMEATRVEQDLLKEPVGNQDQVAVACGGLNRIDFKSDRTFNLQPLTMPPARRQELEDSLLLVFTGFTREAGAIEASKKASFESRKADLLRMHEMVAEGQAILENPREDLSHFGKLLHEAWVRKRGLSSQVSNSDIDDIYQAGIAAGASGGKLLGAGGGGFLLFFAPADRHRHIMSQIGARIEVPFRFETGGCRVIMHDPDLTANYSSDLSTVAPEDDPI